MSNCCDVRTQVHDLEVRTQQCKDNVAEIVNIMATWKSTPLFERSDAKHDSLLKLDDRTERLQKRYAEIEKAGEKIHALLQKNCELFQANEDTDEWRAYVDYVDEMVVDGFYATICCSIGFLLNNTEPHQKDQLFEAKLELHVSSRTMVFIGCFEFSRICTFFFRIKKCCFLRLWTFRSLTVFTT